MPAFLSQAWIDDLAHAVREADDLVDVVEHPIVIGYRVIGVPADDGQVRDRTYHIRLTPDGCSAGPGTEGADVVFETDHATATAIATGALRAQRAFMAGRLRAVGDVRVLLGNPAVVARLAELRPRIGS